MLLLWDSSGLLGWRQGCVPFFLVCLLGEFTGRFKSTMNCFSPHLFSLLCRSTCRMVNWWSGLYTLFIKCRHSSSVFSHESDWPFLLHVVLGKWVLVAINPSVVWKAASVFLLCLLVYVLSELMNELRGFVVAWGQQSVLADGGLITLIRRSALAQH